MSVGKIGRDLPNDEFQAAILANNPSVSNVFATIADLSGLGGEDLAATLVIGNNTGGTDILVDNGDKVDFGGNGSISFNDDIDDSIFIDVANIDSFTAGAIGVGGSSFDGLRVDSSGIVAIYGTGTEPLLDFVNVGGGSSGTLTKLALTAARTWSLPDATGTIALLSDIPAPTPPVAITDDVIPRGTGTTTENGTWNNVGNDIYPTTTGSNIGDATHRIGTIFMSSTVDYSTDLDFNSAGLKFRHTTDGKLLINTTAETTPFSVNVLRLNLVTTHNDTTTASAFANGVDYNPSANTTAFVRAGANRVQKLGANNAGTVLGISSEVRNSGTGAVTTIAAVDAFVWTTGTGNTTNFFGVRARPQVQGASTITNFGGLDVIFGQNAVGSTITNMYGVRVNTPTNTGGAVDRTYGLHVGSNTIGSINNYGIWIDGTTSNNYIAGALSIGASSFGTQKLLVRGAGNTNATTTLRLESASGADNFIMQDDGHLAIGVGIGAGLQPAFGQFFRTANYSFGMGFYGFNCSSAAVSIQMQGSTRTGNIIQDQANPVGGDVKGLDVTINGNLSVNNYGVKSEAKNGSAISVGVYGVAGAESGSSPTTVAPSQYIAGVEGVSNYILNTEMYGGKFSASYSLGATAYTNDIIGVDGEAVGQSGAAGSTGSIIGGRFSASGTAGTGDRIALLVPLTGNTGVTVLGADARSGSSALQVTGEIEMFGNGTGFYMYQPDGTRRQVTLNNAGSFVIT